MLQSSALEVPAFCVFVVIGYLLECHVEFLGWFESGLLSLSALESPLCDEAIMLGDFPGEESHS